ncbi:transposase IS3/IS911 family protein [Mycobacteroides abscessus 3A-0930-R]|nr:transposase IS3/IS911 family protein [Mycobacteroides abscessus 3A-0930-R]
MESVRSWVRQSDIDEGLAPGGVHYGVEEGQRTRAGEPRT